MILTREQIKAIEAIPINFVIGKARSGTTLLQVMLNVHSDIIAPPESRFIILMYFRYGKVKNWTGKIIHNFCNDLFKEGSFRKNWGVDKNELQSNLLTVQELLTFPLICKIIFRMSAPEKDEVQLFFDKNPIYYCFLPELNRLFPEAKYLHLVRDYRATIVSHKKLFKDANEIYIAYKWMKINQGIENTKRYSPKNYLTLKYESLVSNPEQCMKDVCSFLGLHYDENMAQNHQSGRNAKYWSNTNKFQQKLEQPINTLSVNEWEGKFSPKELTKVENIAGKYGETLYKYKVNAPEKVKKTNFIILLFFDLKYRLTDTICRIAFTHLWLYYKIKRNIWHNF